jgi:hypothetical protein
MTGEQAESKQTYKAEVQLIEGGARKVLTCSAIEEQLIFEGDIVIVPNANLEFYGVTITGTRFRWTDGVVVYDISDQLANPDRVRNAMKHWEDHTVIKFRKRTTERDYVIFRPGRGCSSSVGKQGGVQFVTLANECSTGNTIHEIGHTVGLWHEQSREDRDQMIEIHWENISPLAKHNFDQRITDGDDRGDYDFGSIMHYPPNAFSLDGTRTISSKVPGVQFGQRDGLSAGDIAAVAAMYAK